jgi:acyl-CoA synthetase (AMP-forming)/AMP-acid ligase II/acyl carrier protein
MSLLALLDEQYCVQQGSKSALNFLNEQGNVECSLTYSQVQQQSIAIAMHLRSLGIAPGERVLLVYPPSLDFIMAFLGCLRAGIIAVPVFPPDPTRLNKDLEMFSTIVNSCKATTALTSSVYNYASKLASIQSLFTISWPQLKWIVTDSIIQQYKHNNENINLFKAPEHHDIAFLQYTSGSTSEPKGVMISHGNLNNNLSLIITGLRASTDTVVVSWLPQYHDMGLIGSYLGILFCGGTGYYMSPLTYIRNPALWVLCISRYRGTHMQAPNFSYSLTARKFLTQLRNNSINRQDIESLDLSCVRHMINAAEPVEASAIDTFYAVFEAYKLPKNVIFPTYGLAEHTVYVCSNGSQRLVIDKTELETNRVVKVVTDKKYDHVSTIISLGCGKPTESADVDLRIVHTESLRQLPENNVGEIWIKSKSKANGYWGLSEKTQEDFNAALSLSRFETDIPGGGESGFLRTGDLGFLHNKELFICGRIKDLIIIRGRNHYPQDIERTCESNQLLQLRGGCSAAFSIPISGQEVLCYVAEVVDNFVDEIGVKKQIIDGIRLDISKTHGVTAEVVVLVRSRTIKKTSSGKIARQWVRKAYLEGTLTILSTWNNLDGLGDEVYEMQPKDGIPRTSTANHAVDVIDPLGKTKEEIIAALQGIVGSCLKRDPSSIPINKPLASVGIDSMTGITIQTLLDQRFTVAIPEQLIFEMDATIETMAYALITGGSIKQRPVMVDSWKVLQFINQQIAVTKGKLIPQGALSPVWFKENGIRANIDTQQFPDGLGTHVAPLTLQEEVYFIFITAFIYANFIVTPLAIGYSYLMYDTKVVSAVLLVLLTAVFLIPTSRWPPAFRLSHAFECCLKYFSYRVIMENNKVDLTVPTIYAFGPHGIFALAPSIQAILNEYLMGSCFHVLAAPVVFWVPGYNMLLKSLGFKSVDEKSFSKLMNEKKSIGIVPGGIAEMHYAARVNEEVMVVNNRKVLTVTHLLTHSPNHLLTHSKGFIKIALQCGAQIFPCYCFGNSKVFSSYSNKFLESLSRKLRTSFIFFWGRWGLPFPLRVPLLTVIGRPLQCPKVINPTAELVNEYHMLYLKETKRIYQKYRNTYSWQEKPLQFSE